jgi:outer membrane protein assembly factor BamE (lipoprotein component of BamABCDE complex)
MRGSRIAIIWAATLLTAACTHEMGQNTVAKQEAVDHLRIGSTTKSQVQSALGDPWQKTVERDGTENWTYFYSKASIGLTPVAFIPFVGAFAPGTMKGTSESETLYLTLKNGIVSECKYSVTHGSGSSSALSAPLPDQSTTQTLPCG